MAGENSSNQSSDTEPLDRGRSKTTKNEKNERSEQNEKAKNNENAQDLHRQATANSQRPTTANTHSTAQRPGTGNSQSTWRKKENAKRTPQRPSPGKSQSTWRKLTSTPSHPPEKTPRQQPPPRLDTLPERPDFSLAGPGPYENNNRRHDPFIEEGYRQLNPNYDAPAKKPVWGLAKPLPRVVRPGMRRGQEDVPDKHERTAVEKPEPQGAEAIPQLDKIQSQREDSGLSPETPSLGRRVTNLLPGKHGDQKVDSGTPTAEIGNPMDGWVTNQEQGKQTETDAEQQRLANRESYDPRNRPDPRTGAGPSYYGTSSEDDDALDGNLDAKLQWAADNDDLDEFEAEEAEHDYNHWSSLRRQFKEPLAECLGTMIAFLIGICSSLSVMTSEDQAGNYQSTNWAWGLGITLGIYVAGGVSGGHLNPAISLLLSLFRGFPLRKAAVYILAQIFGAFLAGCIAFAVYRPAIYHYSPTSSLNAEETGSAFYLAPKTWPGGGVGVGFSFLTEFVTTAVLGVAILALGDDSNAPPGAGMHALIVGLIVTALTMAFGYTDGCGMNPARDLGPRMAAAAVGYGKGVFEGNHTWWLWGVWGGEIFGALFGGFVYDAAVFVGGESPLNFPSRRWRRRKLKRRVGAWAARKLDERESSESKLEEGKGE